MAGGHINNFFSALNFVILVSVFILFYLNFMKTAHSNFDVLETVCGIVTVCLDEVFIVLFLWTVGLGSK